MNIELHIIYKLLLQELVSDAIFTQKTCVVRQAFKVCSLCGTSSSRRHKNRTERLGRVNNTPASYLEGPGFKSRPGYRLSWLRVFVVFLSPSRRMPG
jgi:hypothetical protein